MTPGKIFKVLVIIVFISLVSVFFLSSCAGVKVVGEDSTDKSTADDLSGDNIDEMEEESDDEENIDTSQYEDDAYGSEEVVDSPSETAEQNSLQETEEDISSRQTVET